MRNVTAEPRRDAGLSTTVERAGAILQLLAQNPSGMSITELTRAFDTQRAPLYRILNALIAYRLVRRDSKKDYTLGVGTIFLAQSYLSQFPSGVNSVLSQLADDTGLTVTLVSADGDVLTTIVSITPSLEVDQHLYTPPGYVFPSGPLATRTALAALEPPSPDEDPEVTEARAKGYAASTWTRGVVRHAMSAVIPYETTSGTRLAIALISLMPFDVEARADALLTAVQTLGVMFRSNEHLVPAAPRSRAR